MGQIKIRFFASFRERLGREEMALNIEEDLTLEEVLGSLGESSNELKELLETGNAIIAVNQEVAKMDTDVKAGDEIAIFPPVSGG